MLKRSKNSSKSSKSKSSSTSRNSMSSSMNTNSSMNSNSSNSGSNSSNSSSNKDDDLDSRADCIRNRSNFSIVKSYHMIDKKDFDPDMVQIYIDNDAAPKIKLLLKKIKALDAKDMKTSGRHYKHLIFTDVNRSAYGAKILASALYTYGMNMVYHPQGTGFSMNDDDKLLETKGQNFAVLLSKAFYDRPVNVKIRKAILEKFNSRPDNVYGDLIRFIILDQGFKEGIDLFDVKYVHLLEPLVVPADEKQAIGRATRFCGQKGLEFHPRFGWPLYVYKYDVEIPLEFQKHYDDAKTLFELYLKYSNLDMRKIIFASQLENATIGSSVDFELNKNVHTFSIEKPSHPSLSRSNSLSLSPRFKGGRVYDIKAPTKIMNLQQMRRYIADHFSAFEYPPLKLENKCVGGGNGNIVTFTPTQDFVRHYFQPQSAYKGILLHHSVGTGKTCTAIATATTSFDVENYTILWVTRHTLKSDIWKNMFGQVCSLDVQERIKNGLVLPNKIGSKFRYISGNWLEPISYKQFSNMLLKRNKIYNEMVRRNGEEDPLKKTLLIIDEAHKLYSPTVAKSEQPDTEILEKMIQGSYDKSGDDSVRVLLMTATPFTEDGMEMIKLLNLLRQKDHFPVDFNKFSQKYLDDGGYFTKSGLKEFQDDVSGYISYLNRSQDARNFAHPVIQNVSVNMSYEKEDVKQNSAKISKESRAHMKEVRGEVRMLKKEQKEFYKQNKGAVKDCKYRVKSEFKDKMEELKENKKVQEEKCKEKPVKERKECKEKVMQKYKIALEKLKEEQASALEKCKNIKEMKLEGNSEMEKIASRLSKLDVQIQEYKKRLEKLKAYNQKNKAVRADVKRIGVYRKAVQAEIKELKVTLKDKKQVLKKHSDNIKKMKDKNARVKALQELRKSPLSQEIKELTKTLKELRSRSSKFNAKMQVMRIKHGLKTMKKISQRYALAKYCKV